MTAAVTAETGAQHQMLTRQLIDLLDGAQDANGLSNVAMVALLDAAASVYRERAEKEADSPFGKKGPHELMDDAATRADWTERSALKVALDFIFTDGPEAVARFRAYLAARVAEEAEQS